MTEINDAPIIYIKREWTSSHGTEGLLIAPEFSCYTLELPWKDNQTSISCIPPGEYNCEIRNSSKFGLIYWVKNVPEREFILIHAGNFAGDISKGLRSNVSGCILLGKLMGFIQGQRAVLNSRIAVKEFMEKINYKPFILKIT
jgi:hypothetical protein